MKQRIISAAIAGIMTLSLMPSSLAAGTVSTLAELKSALTASGEYVLGSDISVTNSGITAGVTVDGGGHTLTSTQTGNDSTIFQNENVSSVFKNLTVSGNSKGDVGIWEGAGSMTISDSVIQNYSISSGRYSAISSGSAGSGKQGNLVLNNVEFKNNSAYDITVADSASVTINQGTSLSKLRMQSNSAKLNIGAGWTGSFEITMDSPAGAEIGTVGAGADISGITVSSDGYYVVNNNGRLTIKNDNGAQLHFDMSKRGLLYKGSTGFLYGEAEPNVPTIDLLYGLQPAVMVQKAAGGLQHPTGDAVRVRSALDAAGARSIQVYLQDIYLEWPYDAPMINGALDVDGYTRTCEQILYRMICGKASAGDAGAFLGNDGNYYVLNEAEAAKYSYVLFNEPDNIWFGGKLEALKAAWKQVYEAVHQIDPNAKCAGPNFAGFNASSYDSFLSYCKTNNCLPELISWHELGDSSMTAYFNNYNSVQSMADKYYPSDKKPQLLVNEYARHRDIATTGGLVKWLAMFEDKDMDGCLAYWGMANSLNEVAAEQNIPSSTWWVYHWYAQMTGEQIPLSSPAFADTRFYGLTAYDAEIPMAYVLFGGSEEKHGTETVYLDSMDKTALVGKNGAVNVKLYGVGYSGQHGSYFEPEIVFNGAVSVEGNTLKIQTTNTDEMHAFFAVVTPTDEAGAAMKDAKLSTLSYEAEDARLLGGAKAYPQSGWTAWAASGRSDVGSINNNGDGVEFTVNVPEDGNYDLALFYSLQSPYVDPQTLEPNAGGQNRGIGKVLPFGMKIDNGETQTIYLDSTISWSYRRHYNTDVYLSAGEHRITFTQINGNEGSKGNLQLVAKLDKIDLDWIDAETRYDFEITLSEMKSFREKDGSFKVTAVAPKAGYYNVSGSGEFTLSRQSVDYAPDADSYSLVSVYDVPVSDTVYLSQGANTITVSGSTDVLKFTCESEKTEQSKASIAAGDIAIHGTNAYYKDQKYASGGKVITELGIGQNADEGDKGEDNYIELNVNVKNEGAYNIAISCANDEPAPVMLKSNGSTYIHPYNIDLVERYAQIKVNDSEPETVYFRHTMSWETFRTVDMQTHLNAGDNTIRIYNDNSYQFSSLVNSTAPEIDTITIAKQSYDGEKITITSSSGDIDASRLDEAIARANAILNDPETIYSEATRAALRSAVEGASRKTQSSVNEATNNILSAIDGLKPETLDLSKYYAASYASSSVGTPQNSFDGSTSTAWETSRAAAPYVAYEVFDAGNGKAFDLTEISMKGSSNTRVVYLGTNSDSILKNPAAMGAAGSDLAKKDNDLYVPFANLYGAKILGIGEGADSVTALSGRYRYFIVAAAVWSQTSVNELGLSAVLADTEPTVTSEPSPTEMPSDEPVLWYDFNDGAKDVSGNDRNGTVNGAVITDSMAVFDGSDDHIRMPNGILQNAGAATVAIYLKSGIEKQNQFTWCIGNSSTSGYMFLNTYNPSSKLRAAITTGTYTNESALVSDSYVSANEWTSIIAVFDGANSALYRDGQLVASADIPVRPSDLGATTANYIARSVYNDPYFKGCVSDFRIYNRALSAEEAKAVSAEQKTSYAKTAPAITGASGEGIKSYGVEIDPIQKTVFIPLAVGTNADSISPQFTCETEATVALKSGSYENGVLTVTDSADPTLTSDWTVSAAQRGNAVLDGYYADPNIAVFGGKYYIYPTTDGGTGWDAPYLKCFSSDDLIHWTDEGIILDLKDVSWSNGKNGWAPTIAEKNGKYYLYYSAAPADNGAKNLAVAVADSPTGPFEDKGVIAKGGSYSGQMIDPAVFTDDDGTSYLYWGNGNTLHAAKLSADMLSLDGAVKDYKPGSFREGAFMVKRKGIYYLMWSSDDTGSPNYHVRYGTMDSPLGTLTGSTRILHRDNAESDIIKGTGHHSVINVPGTDDWYICYHRFNTALYGHQETQSSAAGNHREVCLDKLEFDDAGNIKPVKPTLEGITEPVYINPIEITEAGISGNELIWTLTAKGDISDADIYAVLYDPQQRIAAAAKNQMSGKFSIGSQKGYTLKVFVWKKNATEPLCAAALREIK